MLVLIKGEEEREVVIRQVGQTRQERRKSKGDSFFLPSFILLVRKFPAFQIFLPSSIINIKLG